MWLVWEVIWERALYLEIADSKDSIPAIAVFDLDMVAVLYNTR